MGSFANVRTITASPGYPAEETGHGVRSGILNSSIFMGSLEVRPGTRTILLNGSPIDLGSRAFDVLMTLLVAHGEIVSKEALMRQVWPTTTVEESNLRVQLSSLRRALGSERWRIKTIPGRGYLLVTGKPDEAKFGKAAENAIIVINARGLSVELLQFVLSIVGDRVESVSSPVAFGFRRASPLPAPACLPDPFRLCSRHIPAPPNGAGRASSLEDGVQ